MHLHPLDFKHWLTGDSGSLSYGEAFDRHLLASALTLAYFDADTALDLGLGLSRRQLAALAMRHFPQAAPVLAARLSDGDGARPLSLEEPDLRALLLDHRAVDAPEEAWLAHIIARRALRPNHLWQDLGLPLRDDLSRLMERHFPALAARNSGEMKWKKFFYRELCGLEGVLICKSPVCESCGDFSSCFGGEDGPSLLARAALFPTPETRSC
ncbi:NifQ [mine drainage metagenome]|uniref:NifQ n=1 Tax=mine drainage metagenome TaxID=410659 RepID=A0A1J5R605_9ZZZZ